MKRNNFDVIIIGGGSAGFSCAIKLIEYGAKVLIVERDVVGGTCLNRGCIPSKLLIECTKTKNSKSFEQIIKDKNNLIENLRKEKYLNIINQYENISLVKGVGKFISENVIEVNGEKIYFKKAVVAVGSIPLIPKIEGLNEVNFLTNNNIFDINYLPEKLIIIGGGAIGLELAQAFFRLGSEVTLLEISNYIGGNIEREISHHLEEILKEEGLKIFKEVNITEIKNVGRYKIVITNIGSFKATDILIAIGRKANTENIGLELVGVELDKKGFIKTDEFLRTSSKNIYSAGDCNGKYFLVTVSAMEGNIAGENALRKNIKKIDYKAVPCVIFTDPEVASIGLTEEEASRKGIKVESRTLKFKDVPKALIAGKRKGIIKMVTEKNTGKILGIHILSENASEIIWSCVFILKHNLTVRDIENYLCPYPTLSESVRLCSQSFFKDIKKLSCCA